MLENFGKRVETGFWKGKSSQTFLRLTNQLWF